MGAGGSVTSNSPMSPESKSPTRDGRNSQRVSTRQCPQYEVSFHSAENFKFAEVLPPKFILRISYESLDFVNIGTLTPIIQFPFQHIICWGSSSSNFRFHLFDFERKDSKDGADPDTAGENDDDTGGGGGGTKDISIVLRTSEGAVIEENIMRIVRLLMVDIEKKAVSKEEFNILITTIYNIDTGELNSNWFQTLDQFSTGRTFLAKQCMDLMLLIGPLAPFEKVDLAVLLYSRILTTESFQLIVNTFKDKEERENLIHRLGLKNTESLELVTDCKILPSHVSIPSTPVSPNKKTTPGSRRISPHAVNINTSGTGGSAAINEAPSSSSTSQPSTPGGGEGGGRKSSSAAATALSGLDEDSDLTEPVIMRPPGSGARPLSNRFDLQSPGIDSPDKNRSVDSTTTEYSAVRRTGTDNDSVC